MSESMGDFAENMEDVDLDNLSENLEETQNNEQTSKESSASTKFLDILTSKSPEIDHDSDKYMTHTLNYDKSESTARIIRGMEGILGTLNYALADLVIGFAEKMDIKQKAKNQKNNNKKGDTVGNDQRLESR